MIVVYAPQDTNLKNIMWNKLTYPIQNFNGMSIVLGDFNEVHHEHERFDILFDKSGANFFNRFIHNYGLINLPLGGKMFTRMNKFGTKLSKLDIILVTHQFTSKCPTPI